MKNRTQNKTSALEQKCAGLRKPQESWPRRPSLGGGELSIEALKHWLLIESELMNARRGQRAVSTFTP